MECGLITLLLTCLVNVVSPFAKTGFGNKWENFTNIVITSDVLYEVSNIRSTVECVSLCLMTNVCVSAFYRLQHRRCQLHDVLFMSPQDGQAETGTVYYSLSTGMHILYSKSKRFLCGQRFRCITRSVDSSQSYMTVWICSDMYS